MVYNTGYKVYIIFAKIVGHCLTDLISSLAKNFKCSCKGELMYFYLYVIKHIFKKTYI